MRAANVTLTSQCFDRVDFTRVQQADTSNFYVWGCPHADLTFDFDQSYEVLLLKGEPFAWLYIKVHGLGDSQVDFWHANKDFFLIGWDGLKATKWPDMRDSLEPPASGTGPQTAAFDVSFHLPHF